MRSLGLEIIIIFGNLQRQLVVSLITLIICDKRLACSFSNTTLLFRNDN